MPPPDRIDVDANTVLSAVLDKLQADLGLNSRQAFATVQPLSAPPVTPGGSRYVNVTIGDLSFGFEEAEPEQLYCETTITVGAFVRIGLDSAGREEQFLRDPTRGVLQFIKEILASLHGQDLLTEDGDAFLREYVRATRATQPTYDQGAMLGWSLLSFSIAWDWSL